MTLPPSYSESGVVQLDREGIESPEAAITTILGHSEALRIYPLNGLQVTSRFRSLAIAVAEQEIERLGLRLILLLR